MTMAANSSGGGGAVSDLSKKLSYSDSLKTNIKFDQRLKRNVLEICLEKITQESDFNLESEDVVRVLQTLKIDIVSQVQGYQIQHRGNTSVISVWMNPGIDLEKFCRDVNIKINNGVMTSLSMLLQISITLPAKKLDVLSTPY